MTSVLSRALEKVIKKQVLSFLTNNHILNPNQHGFVKSKSCATCLLELMEYVTTCKDNGHSVLVIYFDISKAFDCVPHKRLISRLKAIGIRDPLLSWFRSFLCGRTQAVRLGDKTSSVKSVTSGVIQGSVLGPLLFNIYTNDIPGIFHSGKVFMFADDIKVVYTLEKSKKDATYDCIHDDLESLRKWSQNWILTFNPSKCNYAYTGHDAIPQDISFCDTQLQRVNITRDLGIFYSLELTFAPHIAHITARCNRLTGQIHRNFDRIESKILLYKMLVLPIVDYSCCFLFGNLL